MGSARIKTTRDHGLGGEDGDEDSPLDNAEDAGGRVIAGRYALLRRLGSGGHGDVWEARDALTGTHVAVKLLQAGLSGFRVRKEVSALRLLNMPGVVRLLDEGAHEGQAFLVMERVAGKAFPGDAAPGWAGLSGPTVALLETLARVHAAGVVHRDIKPSNVLVDSGGRPTLLDFGLAYGTYGDTTVNRRVGTPAYMAPEQALGEPATARSDLFSLGVMLYEALAGRLPYEGATRFALMYARTASDAVPLRDVTSGIPPAVIAVIDRMVSRRNEDRPASAGEVLRQLRGEPVIRETEGVLPRLGDPTLVDRLLAAALAGHAVDLVGSAGSGRSRALQDLADLVTAQGRRVLATAGARRLFASLEPVVGDVLGETFEREEDAAEAVRARLRAALRGGVVVLVDDAEQVDTWSQGVLEDCLGDGAIVRAVLPERASGAAQRVALEPLTEASLRALFSGPERVFHLPTDAAKALWDRTEGVPARVAEELSAWQRMGIARRDADGGYQVERDALDRMLAAPRVASLSRGVLSGRATLLPSSLLSAPLEELLVWITLAWPHTGRETLAAATRQPGWRLDAEARELVRAGVARRREDGRWEPMVQVSVEASWDPPRRASAHRALARALPAGTEGRLVHMLLGADDEGGAEHAAEISAEAVALASRRAAEGALGQGLAALAEGLLAARRCGIPAESEVALLSVWVELALDDGTTRALDRVRYELSRAARTPFGLRLEELVDAALAWHSSGARGLELADAVGAFEAIGLEMRRQNLRVQAARRCELAREQRVVTEAVAWARATTNPAVLGMVSEWTARLRYRLLRFDEAAVLLEEAVRAELDPTRRLSFTRGLALQCIELSRHEEAARWARTVLTSAAALRNAHAECFAECLLRVAAYRSGAALEADRELVSVASKFGERDVEALIVFNEAAVQWRSGGGVEMETWLARVATIWAETGWRGGAALARAMLVDARGAAADEGEVAALGEFAMGFEFPGMAVQILAMIAAPGRTRPEWVTRGAECARRLVGKDSAARNEVLSLRECLDRLGCSALPSG